MEEMSPEAIAAFIALGLTIITSVVMTMRGLARIELNLRTYFEAKQVETYRVVRLDIDESRRMFGETVEAVRRHADLAHQRYDTLIIKHQDLELYIRDNYVEIESFNTALGRIERTIDGMDTKIDLLMAKP
jgi:hypothetical protein